MISILTNFNVADNSGARVVQCIRTVKKPIKQVASIGDRIVVTIKSTRTTSRVKKGTVVNAVIIRAKKKLYRADRSSISFDQNAVVLINQSGTPIGTRILGPVPRELRKKKLMKIISLAPYII